MARSFVNADIRTPVNTLLGGGLRDIDGKVIGQGWQGDSCLLGLRLTSRTIPYFGRESKHGLMNVKAWRLVLQVN